MAAAGTAPADTVIVGDTSFDMHMAANAGAHAIGVAWGYHDTGVLEEAGAHRVLSRLDDLEPTLDRLWEIR